MTKYGSGTRIEYLLRDWLVSQGYAVVRSAGSKGPVDLISFDGDNVYFIQSKSENGKRKSYGKDVRALVAMKVPPCAKKFLMVKRGMALVVRNVSDGEEIIIPWKVVSLAGKELRRSKDG